MTRPSPYETDLDYAIQITRSILRVLGVWPLPEGASLIQKLEKRLQNATCYALHFFIIIPGLLRIFLKESQLNVRLKVLAPLITCSTSLAKYFFILSRGQEINTGLAEMREDWRMVNLDTEDTEHRNIMLAKAKLGRQMVILSAAFIYGGGIPFRTVVPLSKGRILLPDNSTVRALACPSYFLIFNEQITPIYETVFVLQLIAGLMVYSVISGLTGLAAFFVLHTCAQLRILISRMRELTDGDNLSEETVRSRIAVIVKQQMKTTRFLGKVQEIVEQACLAEMVGSTLLLCLTGYCVIMEWESQNTTSTITYGLFLVSFTFCIFIWSYIGQLLDDESNEVYLTSKTIDWYILSPRQARHLILINLMSSASMKITANKMMDMSLRNFANIMRTAVAYLNMLRQVTFE